MAGKGKKGLFKTKPAETKRTRRYPTLWTNAEFEIVETQAKIRNLDVSEFIRRAALGRRADVRFETQTVTVLHHLVQEIKGWRKDMAEGGHPTPDSAVITLIRAACEAMLRISK